MNREERREHLNSSKRASSARKDSTSGAFGKKRRKRGLNFKKVVVSLLAIVSITFSLAVYSFSQSDAKAIKSIPKNKVSASPNPSTSNSSSAQVAPSPTSTDLGYNQIDALSILGVFALARQIPEGNPKLLNSFRSALAIAQKNPSASKIDLGVYGNTLTDYVLSPKGLADPACFAVSAPTVPGKVGNQKTWVIYIEPKSKKFDSLVLVGKGITNCQQAVVAASEMPNNTRGKISVISRNVIDESLLTIPTSFLTKEGLVLLDEDRGFTK